MRDPKTDVIALVLQSYCTCTINGTSIVMRVVSFSEARNSLKAVLDRVVEDAD